jgi:hypothetical protein
MQISAGVRTSAQGAILESRMVVVYTFVMFATAAVVRSPDIVCFEQNRDEILRVLESARPQLRRQTPAAISELWSMEESS